MVFYFNDFVTCVHEQLETIKETKLTSLELRKQALTFRQSSQEAVEAIGVVLNPPVPKLTFQCDKCEKSFGTQFGLSVHLRWHNTNLNK